MNRNKLSAVNADGQFKETDTCKFGTILVQGKPTKVFYVIEDGIKLREGDIEIHDSEFLDEKKLQSEDTAITSIGGAAAPIIKSLANYENKWVNGVVEYTIHPDFPNKQRIYDAMNMYRKYTKVNFQLHKSTEGSYVEFISDPNRNSSPVGRKPDKSLIKIQPDAGVGVIVHEIGHTLGLEHEQSRWDAYKYIKIHWENIKDEKEKANFYSHGATEVLGDFDFDSIMLYGSFLSHVAEDSRYPCISKIMPDGSLANYSAQRDYLSISDIRAINYLYGTNNNQMTLFAWSAPWYKNELTSLHAGFTYNAKKLNILANLPQYSGWDLPVFNARSFAVGLGAIVMTYPDYNMDRGIRHYYQDQSYPDVTQECITYHPYPYGDSVSNYSIKVDYATWPGEYVIRSAVDWNKVLDVWGWCTNDGTPITIYDYHGGANQTWRVEHVSDGNYRIVSVQSGKVMDIYWGAKYSDANVHLWGWNGTDAQLWRIVPVGGSKYILVPKCSGMALHMRSTTNSMQLVQKKWYSGDEQLWRIIRK